METPNNHPVDIMKKDKRWIWIAFGLILIVFIIWGGFWYALNRNPERGTFGDMFGAVNALFSGMAFVGIIIAILMQKEELELQRKELEATRKELEGQKEQFVLQNKTLKKQTFENTFFQMISLHNEIVRNMEVNIYNNFKDNLLNEKEGPIQISGRECFKELSSLLREKYDRAQGVFPKNDENKIINDSYMWLNYKFQKNVDHYFRNLFSILNYIKKSEVDNREFYIKIIQSQLSSNELTVLFYNCLSEIGEVEFKPLMEEFNFFQNIDTRILLSESHFKFFESLAH